MTGCEIRDRNTHLSYTGQKGTVTQQMWVLGFEQLSNSTTFKVAAGTIKKDDQISRWLACIERSHKGLGCNHTHNKDTSEHGRILQIVTDNQEVPYTTRYNRKPS
jgi:hypothetical protein